MKNQALMGELKCIWLCADYLGIMCRLYYVLSLPSPRR